MAGDSLTAPQQISTLESSDFLADVIAGLSSNPRTLPCKYFYDERGAMLFQKICELPEYYITRTEIDWFGRSFTGRGMPDICFGSGIWNCAWSHAGASARHAATATG